MEYEKPTKTQEAEYFATWHLDKRISIGHLVTTIAIVVTFMVWLMRLEAEIRLTKTETHYNASSVARLELSVASQYSEILRRLEKLDDSFNAHKDAVVANGGETVKN